MVTFGFQAGHGDSTDQNLLGKQISTEKLSHLLSEFQQLAHRVVRWLVFGRLIWKLADFAEEFVVQNMLSESVSESTDLHRSRSIGTAYYLRRLA